MKIAFFTESYHPVINGVTLSIDTLSTALEAQGHAVMIYAPATPGQVERDPRVRRFPSWNFPPVPNYPLGIPFKPGLAKEFAALNFDLVHVHTPFAVGGSGMWLGKRRRIPVLAHMHTLYVEYSHYFPALPEPLTRRMLRRLSGWFYNLPDEVVAPSPSVRSLALKYGVRRPIHVIPTGVDMPEPLPRSAARSALGLPPESPVLLYTGRLAREKNIQLLLKAFALVRSAFPDARLLILGTGPAHSDAVLSARTLGIEESVTFAGVRPHQEVVIACSAADLFLFPSSTDTQAISVVEAMACSVPPIVVNAYGPADIVQDHRSGRVVPSDARQMADAAIGLLRNPEELRTLGAAARMRASEYSTDVTTEAMLRVYEALAARGSAGKVSAAPSE